MEAQACAELLAVLFEMLLQSVYSGRWEVKQTSVYLDLLVSVADGNGL